MAGRLIGNGSANSRTVASPSASRRTIERRVGSDKAAKTTSNRSGGVQGGISNGELIYFRVAFKPVIRDVMPAVEATFRILPGRRCMWRTASRMSART